MDGEDKSDGCSSYEFFKPLLQNKVEFPTIEPATWHLSAFKWALWRSALCDAQEQVQHSWLSLLAHVDVFLVNPAKRDIIGMVVHSTPWGVATLPLRMETIAKGRNAVSFYTLKPEPWRFYVITHIDQFQSQPLELVPPYERAEICRICLRTVTQHRLTWRKKGQRMSLLHASSLKCFEGITTARLGKLFKLWKVPHIGKRPTTEKALCEALLRHCWLGWDDDAAQATLRPPVSSVTSQ